MPYTPNHFGAAYTLIRPTDGLFQTVDTTEPKPLAQEPIPLPEVTESDFAAFDALQGGQG